MELSQMDRMLLPGLFAPKEKQSLYQAMCAVRSIGAHSMIQKESHIKEVMRIVGVTSYDQAASRQLNQQTMLDILRNMDNIKKLYFAKFVSLTGLIGGISEKEEMLINWLYSQIGVPTDF